MHHDEIPPGTLYLLILKALARGGELHGYEIATWIEQVSDEVLQVQEGSLYPALQRMLVKGWVTAKWGITAGNRRARSTISRHWAENSSRLRSPSLNGSYKPSLAQSRPLKG